MATIVKITSGKYRAQVRKKGFSRSANFTRKADAAAWASAIERQIEQSVATGFIKPKGLTIGKVIALYEKEVPLKGRTQRATLTRLKSDFRQVTPESFRTELRHFIDKRQKEGAGGVTIAQDLSYLATVTDWARSVRHIDVNPAIPREARAALKHRGLRTRSNERTRVPTDAELTRLYTHWDTNPRQTVPMTLICKFAIASGMRLGEICRIRKEDVDPDRKTVIIRKRKDPKIKETNDQTVPLLPDGWSLVRSRLDGTGRLFGYNARSVSTAFARTCTKLDIADLHFHDLRHLATVNFFKMGLDIPRVALITGHKSWQNLKRYTNLTAEDVHNAVTK